MSINNNSFSTSSNIRFGSKALENMWWNAQTFSLPSISLEPPRHNTRAGAMVNLASDTVTFGDLSIEVILDKEWKVYDAIYQHFVQGLNVEHADFEKEDSFDIWLDFYNGAGEAVKRFWFYKCRITEFGGIDVSTTDPEDEHNTFNISFVFDYMDNASLTFQSQD